MTISLITVAVGLCLRLYRLHVESSRAAAVAVSTLPNTASAEAISHAASSASDQTATGTPNQASGNINTNQSNAKTDQNQLTDKPKNLEYYWRQAGLGFKQIDSLMSDKKCTRSEKLFLSCVNALIQVAENLNLQFNSENQLGPLAAEHLSEPEVKELEPWIQYYRQKNAKNKKFSPESVWKLLKEKISSERESFMVAMGINGYLSIHQDPHSYIIPIEYYQKVLAKANHKSHGLGIVLAEVGQRILVRKIFEGSLAQKYNLQKGDELIQINGLKITKEKQRRIYELLQAKEGEMTHLVVKRSQKLHSIDLLRQDSSIKTVSSSIIDRRAGTALLTLTKFAKQSCRLVKKEIGQLNRQKIKNILFDIRDNSGGQIDEAACIVSLFTGPKRKVFELRYFSPHKRPEIYPGNERQAFKGNLAILINSGSASASEIVAGALKDFKRGILIGEATFGKGSFQEGEVWPENGKVVYFQTQGLFYLPSGKTPQSAGIVPDIKVTQLGKSMREKDLYYNFFVVKNVDLGMSGTSLWKGCVARDKKLTKKSKEHFLNSIKNIETLDLELETAQNTLNCLNQRVSSIGNISN